MDKQRITLFFIGLLAGLVAFAGHLPTNFGVNWSEQGTDALLTVRFRHTSLAFNNLLWVIGGIDNSATESPKVYRSADGISWAEEGTDILPDERADHCSVVFSSKQVVIGGLDDTNTRQDNVYSSSNGTSWGEEGTDAFPVDISQLACAVGNGSVLTAGGNTAASNPVNTVYISSDLTNWSSQGTLPVALRNGTLVFFNERFYFIGGHNGTSAVATVYESDTGSSWQQVGTLPAARYLHTSLVADGKMWVLGGSSGSDFLSTVYSSVNGTTWVEEGSSAIGTGMRDHASAFFEGKMFTTGGETSAGTGHQKVFATDDVAGLTHPESVDGQVSELADAIPAIDQSGDTTNSNLPVIGPVADAMQTDTGFPFVQLTFTLIFGAVACLMAFALARLAPDNKLIAAIGVMVVVGIGFVVGQGVIEWYSLLAIAGLMFGITSLGSGVQG